MVSIFTLLGLAWIFGALINTGSAGPSGLVFQYLFAIFVTLQGFVIFILQCVFNEKARNTLSASVFTARTGSSAPASSGFKANKSSQAAELRANSRFVPGKAPSSDRAQPSEKHCESKGTSQVSVNEAPGSICETILELGAVDSAEQINAVAAPLPPLALSWPSYVTKEASATETKDTVIMESFLRSGSGSFPEDVEAPAHRLSMVLADTMAEQHDV
jgi:hypothetical protein